MSPSVLDRHCACYRGALLLAVLLDGACPATRPPATDGGDPLLTPLHRAAQAGDSASATALIDQGAPIEARDCYGWTPLHRAAIAGRAEVAALLVQRGADVAARGRYDMTPLHWASLRGHAAVVTALLAADAPVDAPDFYSMTPLHLAANRETAQALLDRGAALETRDVRGMTPLHYARTGDVAKALLDRGANVNARATSGATPATMTGVAECKPGAVMVYPSRDTVRVREQSGRLELIVWNVADRALSDVTVAVDSAGSLAVATPARIERFYPGQMVTIALAVERRADVARGKHRFDVTLAEAGAPVATCNLRLDSREGITPEDRGMIPIGTVQLRQEPSWVQYLAYGTVPILLVALWLGWLLVERLRRR
ncbi:MAG: ankyrin repeat domain-containing protein [Deltaproteobacteria bacterium]|nr:ankyrin repeat domain-containing protein [Deltaproteobacteria bacterium]